MDGIQEHRTLYWIEAIVFIILGILAIAIPQIMTLATEMFIGWLFLIGGIIQLFRSFSSWGISGFWPSLISSLLAIIIGALLIAYPLSGIMSLTFLLALYFFADGIARIVFGIEMRHTKRWGWLIVNGILSLALAFIVWSGWPGTAGWVIGLLVGINMLFIGFTYIALLTSKTPVS